MIMFGESLSALTNPDSMLEDMSTLALYMFFLGFGCLICGTVQYGCYVYVAKRQTQRLRKEWFKSILRQDIGWFDVNEPQEMPSRIASSTLSYEEGIGKKTAEGIQFFTTFAAGVIGALVYNPFVALVVFGCMPLLAASGKMLVDVNSEAAEFSTTAYAKANAVAYEVLGNLRTILSVNGTSRMAKRYFDQTEAAEAMGISRSFKVGVANGGMMGGFLVMYCIMTVFGAWLLFSQVDEFGCDPSGAAEPRIKCDKYTWSREMNGPSVLIAMFLVAFGGNAMGQIATSIEAITLARKSIKSGVDVIKRVPTIDIHSAEGKTLEDGAVKGRISLKDVDFRYPSRLENLVCDKYCLEIEGGQTVALVGESGSGKSTIVNLLQRFYDPSGGSVALDGVDLKELNVKWLRSKLAMVGQEPKLFSGTVFENIAHGLADQAMTLSPQELKAKVEAAAAAANAHEFILAFPKGYDTEVGHQGKQLSGGQKQRVAIARAIVSEPKVLLLDEATSALDNKSEKVVQAALDALMESETGAGRTTIVIAHRLSTIRNADKIVVVAKGRVAEEGSHAELMAAKGNYYRLVEAQGGESSAAGGLTSTPSSEALAAKVLSVEEVGSEEAPLGADGDPNTGGKKDAASEKATSTDGKSSEKGGEENDDGAAAVVDVPFARIWDIGFKPDLNYIAMGTVGAVLTGASYPAWGVMFAKMLGLFFYFVPKCTESDDGTPYINGVDESGRYESCEEFWGEEKEDMKEESEVLAGIWVALLAVVMGANIMMWYGFGTASERLSRRVRDAMFSALLRQEPGYFDLPENAVGAVTSRLAKDATLIQEKTGAPIQRSLVTLFALVAGLVMAFVYMWPVALMCLATLPFMGISLQLQMDVMMGTGEHAEAESGEAGAVVGETISAARTVASLSLEGHLTEKYDALSLGDLEDLPKESLKVGLTMGLAMGVQHWNWALLMWWGAWIMDKVQNNDDYDYSFEDFNIALFCFFFGLFGLGAAGAGGAGALEVKQALGHVFAILDRASGIDPDSKEGSAVTSKETQGGVALTGVDFTYPSRPDLQVMHGYSLGVEPGMTVGLVGSSGSGKSTAIQLIERFYDPDSGAVTLDGKSLKEINYTSLHNVLGFVGQEPVLFSGTVYENIALGLPADAGLSEEQMREKVELAAIKANAHQFISSFPDAYDTDIATDGELLSGGQKQRVAIARAIVSEPKVLLLDEATSALDSESEGVVQAAIDALAKDQGMTCITIAHRLSTIRDCNKIAVVDKGTIVEEGTHEGLMAMKGQYADLVGHS